MFTYIYEGAPDWAHSDARPLCAIAALRNVDNTIEVTKLITFHNYQKD